MPRPAVPAILAVMSNGFRAIAATLLMQVSTSLLWMAVPVLGPRITASAEVAASRVGEYSGLLFLGAVPPTLLAGLAIARLGALRVIQLGVALSAAGLALVAAGEWAAVLAAALVVGAGYGPAAPASSDILARHTSPRARGLVFSIKQSGVPVGGVLAGALLPPLALAFGWRAALFATVALALAAALLVDPLRRHLDGKPAAAAPPLDGAALRRALSPLAALRLHPDLPRLSFVGFAAAALQGIVFALFVTYLVERLGFGLVEAGLAFSALQLAGVAARIGSGIAADRWLGGRRVLALLGAAGLAATVMLAALGPGLALAPALALAAATGFAVAGWNGVYLAELAHLVPSGQVGSATGGALFFVFLGYVAGPLAASAVIAASGSFALAFLAAGALSGAAAVSELLARRR